MNTNSPDGAERATLTSTETDAVLAGLRMLQLAVDGNIQFPPGIANRYEPNGAATGLSSDDIDDLCLRLNTTAVDVLAQDEGVEITRCLTVSTAHLTRLERENFPDTNAADYPHGFYVWVGNAIDPNPELADVSEGFRGVIDKAWSLALTHVRFEADADELPDVPSYVD